MCLLWAHAASGASTARPHAFEVDLHTPNANVKFPHLDHERPVHLTCAWWAKALPAHPASWDDGVDGNALCHTSSECATTSSTAAAACASAVGRRAVATLRSASTAMCRKALPCCVGSRWGRHFASINRFENASSHAWFAASKGGECKLWSPAGACGLYVHIRAVQIQEPLCITRVCNCCTDYCGYSWACPSLDCVRTQYYRSALHQMCLIP